MRRILSCSLCFDRLVLNPSAFFSSWPPHFFLWGLKGSHKSREGRISPPKEDHIILQFGVMRLSCDSRDIYVRAVWIWRENPSTVSETSKLKIKPFLRRHILIQDLILNLCRVAPQVQTNGRLNEVLEAARRPLLQPWIAGDLRCVLRAVRWLGLQVYRLDPT